MDKHTGRKFIPVEEAFRVWDKEPAFRKAYKNLRDEFVKAAALIEAQDAATDRSKAQTGPAKKLA